MILDDLERPIRSTHTCRKDTHQKFVNEDRPIGPTSSGALGFLKRPPPQEEAQEK